MLDVMHGSIIFDLLPFPPPAYPRGFAIFFFLGSLFPTPGHAERDYNYNPELLIDHINVFFGTSFKEQYLFPYIENTSWKVLAYAIYARVVDVSEIERVSAVNE